MHELLLNDHDPAVALARWAAAPADEMFFKECGVDPCGILHRTVLSPTGSRCYWRNAQWIVNLFRLQTIDGRYGIKRTELWRGDTGWGWIAQLSEKEWADVSEFARRDGAAVVTV